MNDCAIHKLMYDDVTFDECPACIAERELSLLRSMQCVPPNCAMVASLTAVLSGGDPAAKRKP